MKSSAVGYKRHRFPQQVISNAVWLYFRFPLSLRLVEEMLLERGIVLSYETIRRWGYAVDEIVQSRRDTKAANRLLIRQLKKAGMPPKRIVTDKLRSYGAAKCEVMPAVEHRSHKGLNNRAENSHLPLRKRERTMQGFQSPGSLQRFISIFSALRNLFVTSGHKRSALAIHIHRIRAIAHWKAVTGAAA
jgi:putative transposase